MKNLIFTLLASLFISLSAIAQIYTVTVHGSVMTVTANNVSPVPNQPVTITIDSVGFGFNYLNTVYTDEAGYYEDIVEIPQYNGYGFVQTMTYDSCLGYNQYNYQAILPGSTLQPMDFYLCSNTPPECQASFYFYQSDPAEPYTFSFVNQSSGNFTEVFWSFGDSTFSTEMSPVHTFPGEGTYYVCLTISNGQDCNSTYCEYVITGGTGSGCENYFLYYNSNNDLYTLTFEGYLMNGQYAQYYSWDFGDGTYGNGQTVTHTYNPQGVAVYLVSLTTMVLDSMGIDSCFYTSTQEVWIQNQTGCNAYFTYYPDSLNLTTINFLDKSYDPAGLPPYAWFWDFGDGTSSTLQNPVHTYADTAEYYTVCLTINAADSCTSTYCEEVYTGYIQPPSECESFILPISMYGLTVDFEGYTVSQYETQYTWEFGDGVTGMGQYVSHTYPAAGMYNVTLQTVDAVGCYFQTFTQIWLDSTNQGGCSASFTYDQADSTTFTFYGFVYLNNGGIYPDSTSTYLWDFGDGTTGTGQTITHYFQENPAGGYNVCLTATMVLPAGYCTSVYCEYISFAIPSFNIFGYVYLQNNMNADEGVVNLMSMDTTWQGVIEVQSTTIDSGGYYNFSGLPLNNTRLYFVQAELTEGSAYYGQYLPTYHINALNWELANPILPINSWTADIFMIPGNTVDGGNGSITGVVSDLGTRGLMNDIEVVLMDADKNPLIYLRSDDQGAFTFENLALGTYVIHAEIMGIHTVQAEITLSEQNPAANVEVQVSGGEANVVFGLSEHYISLEEVSDIYPNPANDNAKIDITVKKESNVVISIIGMTGQIMDNEAMILVAGSQSINLEMSSLPEGIYLVRITSEYGDMISRKLMKY